MNMILNRKQVQVYDIDNNMIHLGLYEGFSNEEIIRNARKAIDLSNIQIRPITFFIADEIEKQSFVKKILQFDNV